MYCPKCNQQQPSAEMRFCSRCGFPLTIVAHLLAHDGKLVLPAGSGKSRSSRRKLISESAYLTLIAWGLALGAMLLFDYGGPFETAAKLAASIFFLVGLVTLMRFLYAFLFVSDSATTSEDVLERLLQEQAKRPALAPQSQPVSDYPLRAAGRANTKEMVSRPSVTEHTTRLLDEPTDRVE